MNSATPVLLRTLVRWAVELGESQTDSPSGTPIWVSTAARKRFASELADFKDF